MTAIGHEVWAIAEGWIPGRSSGPDDMESHETVSILNTSDQDAHVEITIYFTDREPAGPYPLTVRAGHHWLGRIAGEWRYDTPHPAHDVDLVHVRDCEWMPQPVPEEHVPPGVRASFARGGRNWQQIHAAGVSEATAAAWKTRVEQGNTIRR